MSDDTPVSAHPGTLSPRNIDTVRFRILSELPYPELGRPGDGLAWWPQGETFANLNGCLRAIRNTDILEWEAAGKLERVDPAGKPAPVAAEAAQR